MKGLFLLLTSLISCVKAFPFSNISKISEGMALEAAIEGEIFQVTTALEEGLKVDYTNTLGNSLLLCAASTGNADLLKLLLHYKETNRVISNGKTALDIALEQQYYEFVEILVESLGESILDIGNFILNKDSRYYKAGYKKARSEMMLGHACQDHFSEVKKRIEQGCDIRYQGRNNMTLLDCTIYGLPFKDHNSQYKQQLEYILDANPKSPESFLQDHLIDRVLASNAHELISCIVERFGSDILFSPNNLRLVLSNKSIAADEKILIEQNKKQQTFLHFLVKNGEKDIILAIAKTESKDLVMMIDKKGRTPLGLARKLKQNNKDYPQEIIQALEQWMMIR